MIESIFKRLPLSRRLNFDNFTITSIYYEYTPFIYNIVQVLNLNFLLRL